MRLPRALLDPQQADLGCGDDDGLLPVRLRLEGGCIRTIEPLPPTPAAACSAEPLSLPLAITPPVDPHVHLDKAFSWPAYPNRQGSLAAALAVNLREGERRSRAQVLERAGRALDQAWRYGLRALRSHVDSGGPCAEPSWEALLELQAQWRGRVELQLAAELGCGLDLHVDEAGEAPAAGVRLLVQLLERWRPPVPITCSHASSMGLLRPAGQRRVLRAGQWLEPPPSQQPPPRLASLAES